MFEEHTEIKILQKPDCVGLGKNKYSPTAETLPGHEQPLNRDNCVDVVVKSRICSRYCL